MFLIRSVWRPGDIGPFYLWYKILTQITLVRDQADKGDYRPCGLRTHLRYQIRQIGQGSTISGLIGHPSLCLA